MTACYRHSFASCDELQIVPILRRHQSVTTMICPSCLLDRAACGSSRDRSRMQAKDRSLRYEPIEEIGRLFLGGALNAVFQLYERGRFDFRQEGNHLLFDV